MNSASRWSLTLGLVLAMGACAPPVPANPPETRVEPTITGGWSQATIDEDAKSAAVFAVAALNRPGAALKSLDAAQSQVVAGLNYRLDLTLTDGSRWQVVVYRNLQSAFSLTSSTPLP
jgi:hypothetical protein